MSPAPGHQILSANSAAYEWLVAHRCVAARTRDAEGLLEGVNAAACFAIAFHPGRFADGAIENVVLELGMALERRGPRSDALEGPDDTARGRRRVLHVTCEVAGIGGHSRMIHHWVRNDRDSTHSLVMKDRGEPAPSWLQQAIRESGGRIFVLPPSTGYLERARRLRELVRRSADLAVVHHSGSDVIATLAFASEDLPPVALLNHADHEFWLGSTVADAVINLRSAAIPHTAERRFVAHNVLLPVPLPATAVAPSRADARRALGIEQGQIVLLSVGRGIKYRPCGPFDFVKTANAILQRLPRAHLYVVGESAAGIAPYLRSPPHERLHFVGVVEDPSAYRAAADVYLESFPFGSQTALLEAALAGLPVVPAYAPLSPLLVANDDAVTEILPNPPDERAYVESVEAFVEDAGRRRAVGQLLRERLLVDHLGEGWLRRLADVYREVEGVAHRARPIPHARCLAADADVGLSRWNMKADGRWRSMGPVDTAGAESRHAAYVAKRVGDYARARAQAIRAVREAPHRWASWRLLGAVSLGPCEQLAVRLLRGSASRA